MDLIVRNLTLPLIALLVLAALVNLNYGLNDSNLIFAFETDEGRVVERVEANLANNDLDPRSHYNYGYLYETVTFALCRTFQSFGYNIDTRFVGSLLRLLCLFSSLISLYFVYETLRFLGVSSALSSIAALFLFSSLNFYFWSQTMHPDLPQTAFIAAAMYCMVRFTKYSGALTGAVLSGLAFGTKYSGIFIFPFTFLPHALYTLGTTRQAYLRTFKQLLLKAVPAGLIFVLCFLAVNPYVVVNHSEALYDFRYEKKHVSIGDEVAEPADPLLWFPVIENEFGKFGVALLALGLTFSIGSMVLTLRKKGVRNILGDQSFNSRLALLLYFLVGFLYIVITVRMRVPRFLFHLLPVAVVLSFEGISRALKRLPTAAAATVVAVIFVATAFRVGPALSQMKASSHKPLDPIMELGEFFELHVPKTARILSDYYGYIPTEFKNLKNTWTIDDEAIKAETPDILVFTVGTTGRWAWKKPGTSFKERKFDVNPKYGDVSRLKNEFLTDIFAPQSGWALIWESNTFAVLARESFRGQLISYDASRASK